MTDQEHNDKTSAEAGQATEKHKTAAKKKTSKGAAAPFLAQLALISAVLIAAGLFYLWMEQQDHVQTTQRSLAELGSGLESNQKTQQQALAQQQHALQTLQEQHNNLAESFASLLKTSSHLRNDWLMTEAEYLIKLANHRLLLERDVNTAIVAMQSADQRLRDVADPGLLKIRKQIAEDINALRAVPQPDLSGMSFTLSALGSDVDQMPLATPDPASIEKRTQAREKQTIDDWRELPAAVWRDIKSLVIIRHHDDPVQPLLSPEQHFFLTQNLRLQLEQARLALLNGHDKVFKERLQQARDWIDSYFDKNDSLTQHVMQQLAELAARDIKPDLPDVSATYLALHDFRSGITGPAATDKPAEAPAAEETITEDSKQIEQQSGAAQP